jgi:hypothetical protein
VVQVNPLAADLARRRKWIREAGHVTDRYDALRIEQFENPVQIEIVSNSANANVSASNDRRVRAQLLGARQLVPGCDAEDRNLRKTRIAHVLPIALAGPR